MKSYVTKFIRGLVGAFTRKPDGSLECTGLALTEESAAAAAADPSVPHLRLGKDEIFCGRALGVPAVAHDTTAEERASDEEFEMARKIAEWKKGFRH